MKVLITGGTGFIGSHTVRAAVDAGHEVRLLARSPRKVPVVLDALRPGLSDLVEVVPGDATDAAAVRDAVDGCDAVVHAAAVVALSRAESARAYEVNTTAGRTVLGAAVDAGCDPVVHVSSVSVFALGTDVIGLDAPLSTSEGGYGRSKTEIEWFAQGLQAAGAPVTVSYPAGVIGPSAPGLTALHDATLTWLHTMPFLSSGVNLVDVRDLAEAHVAMLEPGRGPRRFMLGGRYITWEDLAALIEQLTGNPVRRLPTPGWAIRGMGRFLDITRIPIPTQFPLTHEAMVNATRAVPFDSDATRAALGVSERPIAETMEDTLRWLRDAGHVDDAAIGRLAGGRT